MTEEINIIESLIKAISILNDTDTYLESLDSQLSECDSLRSDYDHLIENGSLDDIDLKKLYLKMQENFNRRRKIKENIALRDNYKNLTSRLNNSTNRGMLLQNMKNCQAKLGQKYHNRVLTAEDIDMLKVSLAKRGRGRPKKVKEGV